jgi:hypothetical protein
MALEAPQFVRALVLIAPVSHPWPGGIAWYYMAGAHPLLGPPLRRLIALPAGMAVMGSALRSVFGAQCGAARLHPGGAAALGFAASAFSHQLPGQRKPSNGGHTAVVAL